MTAMQSTTAKLQQLVAGGWSLVRSNRYESLESQDDSFFRTRDQESGCPEYPQDDSGAANRQPASMSSVHAAQVPSTPFAQQKAEAPSSTGTVTGLVSLSDVIGLRRVGEVSAMRSQTLHKCV